MSINSQSLDGLSHAEVVDMLKNAYGDIVLQVHTHTAQYKLTEHSTHTLEVAQWVCS